MRFPISQFNAPSAPDVSIVGIPFDLGTTNRSGARYGPSALREASMFYNFDYHPFFGINPAEHLDIVDMGDVSLTTGYIEESIKSIEEQYDTINSKHIVSLGGDHTCALPVLRSLRKKYDEPVTIVHFDAHPDTWKDSWGGKYGHGTPFHFATEEGLIDPTNSIQIGIRSPMHPDVMEYTKGLGFTVITSEDVHMGNPIDIAIKISDMMKGKNVYLTFDIDCIDPSQAPGTGTPEIGGLFTWQVLAILQRLFSINFVGMDLMEVAPAYDHSQITSQAGACIIWTYLCLLAKKKIKIY
jgi:agmatinase